MKRSLVISLLSFLLVTGVTVAAEIRDIHWTLGPDFPHYRKGGAFGVVEGNIVSACGMEYPWAEAASTFMLPSVEADTWVQLPNCPLGRAYVQGTSLGNSLYLVGGRRSGRTIGDVDKLTKSGEGWSWSSLPDLNQDRGWAPVVPIGTKIYAVGGFDSENFGGRVGHTLNSIEMLETAAPSPTWTVVTQIPGKSRGWLSAAAVQDKLYVFGGAEVIWNGPGDQSTLRIDNVQVYDPAEDTWETLPPLPFPLSGTDSVVYDDRYVILFGGYAPNYPADLQKRKEQIPGHKSYHNPFVIVYDTLEHNSKVLPTPMPYPTNDIRAAWAGDTIVTFAGENVDPATSNTTKWVRFGTIENVPEPSTTAGLLSLGAVGLLIFGRRLMGRRRKPTTEEDTVQKE